MITADAVFEVVLNEEAVLSIDVDDADEEDTVELMLITEIEGGVLDIEEGEFRWTPTEIKAVEIRYHISLLFIMDHKMFNSSYSPYFDNIYESSMYSCVLAATPIDICYIWQILILRDTSSNDHVLVIDHKLNFSCTKSSF